MKRHHILIASTLLASLGPLVGNGLYAVPDSGEAILADAREGLSTLAYAAYTLELIGFAALAVLFAWLASYLLVRMPVAALTTAIVGSAMLAVKLASAAPMMTVYSMPEALDPGMAEALISLNDQSFVISGFLMSLAFLVAGVGLLATDFPRWLSWWATVAGGLGVVAGIVGIARPEAYVPIPFLLLLVWMLAVAVTAVMRPVDAVPAIRGNRTHQGVAVSE